MPMDSGLPRGTLVMLLLRVLRNGPLHGYAIAQRIHELSSDDLKVEEGSLYPALQKARLNGWVKSSWTTSDTSRRVREYRLTSDGMRQLDQEITDYRRMARAIETVLETA